MAKEIKVCPHCGRKLSGQEFLPNVENLPQQVGIAYDRPKRRTGRPSSARKTLTLR